MSVALQFPCHLCPLSFSRKTNLQRHVAQVHENKKDYVCGVNECDRSFKRKHDLAKHHAAFHESAVVNTSGITAQPLLPTSRVSSLFGCSVPHCLARFDTRAAFTEHFLAQHAPPSSAEHAASTAPTTTTTTTATTSVTELSYSPDMTAKAATAVLSPPITSAVLCLSTAVPATPIALEERSKRVHADEDLVESADVEAAALALCCCAEPQDDSNDRDKRRKREGVAKSLSRALLCCKWTITKQGGADCHGSHRYQHLHQLHSANAPVARLVDLAWKPLDLPLDDSEWWWWESLTEPSASSSTATATVNDFHR
jgi:hypothetical protein